MGCEPDGREGEGSPDGGEEDVWDVGGHSVEEAEEACERARVVPRVEPPVERVEEVLPVGSESAARVEEAVDESEHEAEVVLEVGCSDIQHERTSLGESNRLERDDGLENRCSRGADVAVGV